MVFKNELAALRVQASSLGRFVDPAEIGRIWVVINDPAVLEHTIDPAWWGPLQHKVYHYRVNTHSNTNGWLTQQLCKLQTAALATQAWSMVLDAKTIFVRDWHFTDIHTDQGLAVGVLPVFPEFAYSKKLIDDLFDISLEHQLGPGGVPFFFHTESVKNMRASVESLTGQEFGAWFLQQGQVTEFMLYSGWLQYQHGGFAPLYSDQTCFEVENVCHSEVDRFEIKFDRMQTTPVLTVSVHRNAWCCLTDKQQQQYRDFLISRGLKEAQQL